MPFFAAKPKSTHVQKTLYELKDADEIRHLAIGAGARVVDLVNAKTGAVHDTVPTMMYAIKTSTTRKTSVWGMVANVIGAMSLADNVIISTRMAFPKAYHRVREVPYSKLTKDLDLDPKIMQKFDDIKPVTTVSVQYYWMDNAFVRDMVSTASVPLSDKKVYTIKSQKILKNMHPISTTLLSAVFGLYLLSIPRRVPFQRRLPANLSAALVTMNQQSALDDRAFVEVTALADAAPGAHPPPLDYALTKGCLASMYPSLHRLFRDFVPPKQRASSSKKASAPPPSAANHPTLCALRAALLRQRTVPVRPIHLFRTNSLPRESVAEIALAISMHWRYRELPYYAYRGALRLVGRMRAGTKTAKTQQATRGASSSTSSSSSSTGSSSTRRTTTVSSSSSRRRPVVVRTRRTRRTRRKA